MRKRRQWAKYQSFEMVYFLLVAGIGQRASSTTTVLTSVTL